MQVAVTGKLKHASLQLDTNHLAGGHSHHLIRVCGRERVGLIAFIRSV